MVPPGCWERVRHFSPVARTPNSSVSNVKICPKTPPFLKVKGKDQFIQRIYFKGDVNLRFKKRMFSLSVSRYSRLLDT